MSADGDAVARVEEDDRSELSENDSDVFLASTAFHLADGSELPGLCSPVDPSGLDYLQPVIIVRGGQVRLWDEKPTMLLSAVICRALGRAESEVFPMSFTCHVPVDGSIVSGTLDLGGALPNQALQLTVNLPPFGRSDDRS